MYIFEKLPESLTIDNINYPIDTDFRVWLKFEKIINKNNSEDEKLADLLLFIKDLNLPISLQTFQEISIFFSGHTNKEQKDNENDRNRNEFKSNKKSFDFEKDSIYIFSAFLSQYNVDLTVDKLHWWKFKALFQALDSNCQFSKIIHYRTVNLNDVPKEQKNFYKEMKQIYKLDDDTPKMTTEEYHNKILNYVNKRFNQMENNIKKRR